MINSEEGLRRTREVVALLENLLESLERDKEKMHPTWYETQTVPVIEQLAELQAEIDQYLATVRPAGTQSTPEVPMQV